MRIVGKAEIRNPKIYRYACSDCGAIFDFCKNELTYRKGHYKERKPIIKCPECKHEFDIFPSDMVEVEDFHDHFQYLIEHYPSYKKFIDYVICYDSTKQKEAEDQ